MIVHLHKPTTPTPINREASVTNEPPETNDAGGSDSGRSEAWRSLKPRLARVGRSAVAVAACGVAYLLGRALGPALREAAMVSTETSPVASVVSFDDASELAAAFLAGRDTATVAAPWDMTARDVLRLYHLENNQSARAALLEQLGVADLDAVLPRGSSFSFVLSPERLEP